MAATPEKSKFTHTQLSLVKKIVEKKRSVAGVPKRKETASGQIYVVDPAPIDSLIIYSELKNRTNILKQLQALEKRKEAGEDIVFCHLTRAFLLLNTSLLTVIDYEEVQYEAGKKQYKVEVLGIEELFLEAGATMEEIKGVNKFSIPSYLSNCFEAVLKDDFAITWNTIKAVSVNTKTTKSSPASPKDEFEEPEEDLQTTPLSPSTSSTTSSSKETTYVYTTIAFLMDDFTTLMPRELLPLGKESRLLEKEPKAPKPVTVKEEGEEEETNKDVVMEAEPPNKKRKKGPVQYSSKQSGITCSFG